MKSLPLFILILLIAACRSPKEADIGSVPFTAHVGVTVIDGKGNPPKENQVVLVQDNYIVRIGNRRGFDYPRNCRRINHSGKYMIPGLIDMHAHVTVLPIDSLGRLVDEFNPEASLLSLQTLLQYGVTTVRNPAAPTRDGVLLRSIADEDTSYIGPRILTAGAALNRTKVFFGPFVATPTPKAIRYEIQQQAEAGVDFLKVYASLKPRLTQVAIEAAHQEGLEVIGHLQNTSWTEATRMGIDAITHAAPWHRAYLPAEHQVDFRPDMRGRLDWLEYVDYDGEAIQEMLQLMADSQVVIDPTLIAFHTKFWNDDSSYTHSADTAMVHPGILAVWRNGTFVDHWTAEDYQRAKRLWPKLLELTKRMYDRGCFLTVGSDFPNPWVLPGKSMHQEMVFYQDAGIPPLDIIKAATWSGARALHLEEKLGAIAPGLQADFLILGKDPLEDMKNVSSIEMIVKGGEEYVPEDL